MKLKALKKTKVDCGYSGYTESWSLTKGEWVELNLNDFTIINTDTPKTDQCFCQSYIDDDGVIQNCTCGKCKLDTPKPIKLPVLFNVSPPTYIQSNNIQEATDGMIKWMQQVTERLNKGT